MDEYALSVSRLNAYISKLISSDDTLADISVMGEISNYKEHSSGHLYFSLKDASSRINCVMFRSAAYKLNFDPADGMKVIVRGRIGLYEKSGVYQLYAEEMREAGVGALYEKYAQLLAELREKGYFDKERKKFLPYLPKKVAVITSPTGAAVRDMITVMKRRSPITEIIVCPVLVQGAGASRQIADMIDYVNLHEISELIIIGRGGGSIEDLWAFNEIEVAQSIYDSKIPVISAVGHETDFTIADYVADMRAPTPSAAAELAVPDLSDVQFALGQYLTLIKEGGERKLNSLNKKLDSIRKKRVFTSPLNILTSSQQTVDMFSDKINTAIISKLKAGGVKLDLLSALLKSLSMDEVLSRGYLAVQKEGRLVRADAVGENEDITLVGMNNIIEVRTMKVREKNG
ncbi:MAG: exodeoxyribonuclease VII large subunit [Eubacteriaceae bacterium]|nr:exodeoxyribonuclease VII large subunit [Eubacteriaceae bacterium]